jgi:hypothetical protein
VHAQRALDVLRALGVVPEVRVECLAGQVFYFSQAVIYVKDTSLTPPACLSGLLTVLQSWLLRFMAVGSALLPIGKPRKRLPVSGRAERRPRFLSE